MAAKRKKPKADPKKKKKPKTRAISENPAASLALLNRARRRGGR